MPPPRRLNNDSILLNDLSAASDYSNLNLWQNAIVREIVIMSGRSPYLGEDRAESQVFTWFCMQSSWAFWTLRNLGHLSPVVGYAESIPSIKCVHSVAVTLVNGSELSPYEPARLGKVSCNMDHKGGDALRMDRSRETLLR